MRILVADDHGIVRAGIKLLLERQPDLQVVAEAADGVEAVEQALRAAPALWLSLAAGISLAAALLVKTSLKGDETTLASVSGLVVDQLT